MGLKIILRAAGLTVTGELYDSPGAQAIARALPLEAAIHTWGEEIYFSVPVQADLDATARGLVDRGDICYWPPGQALCLFFGPTPISGPDEIRPAGPVNLVGKLTGDFRRLHELTDGIIIFVEAIPEA